jgi:hypothetical protein
LYAYIVVTIDGGNRIVAEGNAVTLTALLDLPGLRQANDVLSVQWYRKDYGTTDYPTTAIQSTTIDPGTTSSDLTDTPEESSYYKIVLVDQVGTACTAEVLVVVMKLSKILFHDSHAIYYDPGVPPFNTGATEPPTPYVVGSSLPNSFHWIKTSTGSILSKPVCYTRNTPFKASVFITMNGLEDIGIELSSIQLKGTGTIPSLGSYAASVPIGGLTVLGNGYLYSMTTATATFPNAIGIHELTINWEYSQDAGATWSGGGDAPLPTTSHQVYLTLNNPTMNQPGQYLFRTTLHIACQEAAGLSDVNAAVDAIYAKFATRNVQNLSGQALRYWHDIEQELHTTQELLYHKDGRCRAWSRFFRDMLNGNGINTQSISVQRTETPAGTLYPPLPPGTEALINQAVTAFNNAANPTDIPTFSIENKSVFLVKNWNVQGDNFYKLLSQAPENYETLIGTPTNAAANGVPAQSNENPYSFFYDHALVKVNGKYYDPSYGTGSFNSLGDWEANSIAAFGAMITHSTPTIFLLWIEKLNTSVSTETDLQEYIINY